ncbi:MAG: hypothetical protein E4G97_03370 [Deltaproteobacteria bacterium]|nr:MAG: hypothetical protein E4G97_03370 [Deltaproteobacteria bacterium]
MVFVLILAAISLAMALAMLFMVSRGSYVSSQQKRFRTAVEAGLGGMEAMFQMISNNGDLTTPYTNQVLPNGVSALKTKLAGPLATWGGLDNSSTINSTDTTSYDMRIDIGTYRVYSKIVDTVQGNSSASDELLKTGVVDTSSGEVVVVSIPYLYTIEVLSHSTTNSTERSKLSVLYQY